VVGLEFKKQFAEIAPNAKVIITDGKSMMVNNIGDNK
jgi:hypothetical protein